MKPRLMGKQKGTVTLFPGITIDAVTLGVSRNHLYRVLRGQTTSRPLIERYRRLKAEQQASRLAQQEWPEASGNERRS